MLSAIVAMAHDRVIGSQNDLPWYLPADLKHFKELTIGGTVIMGRRTSDSIFARLGHALPDRHSVVVTRNTSYEPHSVTVVHSIQDAFKYSPGEAFIIGGAELYNQTMDLVDRLYVTEIDADIAGDTFFPVIDPEIWHETSRETHEHNEKNPYNYAFVTYDRVR